MVIGIVSKPDHAKNHAAALEQDGHTIHLLGASPIDFPQDIEVMVLRHLSSSHGGIERARNHAKARRIPIVAENGLSGIRMAINALDDKYVREFTMDTPTPENSTPMNIEVNESLAIAESVLSGKPSSFVKQLLSQYSKVPTRFLYICMNSFADDNTLPSEQQFLDFYSTLNPNEPVNKILFSAFYNSGVLIKNLSKAEFESIRENFLVGDASTAGSKSFFPNPLPAVVKSLSGRPYNFCSFYMWLLANDRPKRTSIAKYAYGELSGKQLDPTSYANCRDSFGFEVTMIRGTQPQVIVASETAVIEETVTKSQGQIEPSPKVTEVEVAPTWQNPILKTVQEEILNLAIGMEEIGKLTKRVDVIDNGLGHVNTSMTRFESLLRDLNQAKQEPENDNTFFEERFKKAGQEYQNLKDWVSTIQNEQRHTQSMVSDLQSDMTKLAEQVMALVEQVKNRPAVEGANVESAIRTLKTLGATVTITLPA